MISTSTTSPSTITLLRPLWLLLTACNFSHASYITVGPSLSPNVGGASRSVVTRTPRMTRRFWLQQQHQQWQHAQLFTTSSSFTTRLYDASFGPWRDSLDDSNHPDDFDIEAARERLESLVLDGGAGKSSSEQSGPETADQILSSSSSSASRLQQPPTSSSSSQSPFSFASMEKHQTAEDDIFPFPLPRRRTVLTSIERERREAEIQLLSRLADGDDVLVEIWALWFQERGPQAAARLVQAEELMTMTQSTPPTQQQSTTSSSSSSSSSSSNTNSNSPEQQVRFRFAEKVLLELIREYGLDWSEPINRLATLYYMTGRFSQAVRACQLVLENKPWHFGTLSGIVMVYASLQDSHHARHFAAHRLPTFASIGPNRRRRLWVETAMAQAQQSLLDAERRAHAALGEPDAHAARQGQRNIKKEMASQDKNDQDDDAWQ